MLHCLQFYDWLVAALRSVHASDYAVFDAVEYVSVSIWIFAAAVLYNIGISGLRKL